MGDIIKQNKNNIIEIDGEVIKDYLLGVSNADKLTGAQIKLFVNICKSYGLNPIKKEVYAIPYKNKNGGYDLSIVTGYETYLKRAERSGKWDGFKCYTEQRKGFKLTNDGTVAKDEKGHDLEVVDLVAVVEIFRKDWTEPFKHEVLLSEYQQKNYKGEVTKFWREKPHTMLKKVATAQGFRLAFPDEFGGMPYTNDELPDAMTRAEVSGNKNDDNDPEENKKLMLSIRKHIDSKRNKLTEDGFKKFVKGIFNLNVSDLGNLDTDQYTLLLKAIKREFPNEKSKNKSN